MKDITGAYGVSGENEKWRVIDLSGERRLCMVKLIYYTSIYTNAIEMEW